MPREGGALVTKQVSKITKQVCNSKQYFSPLDRYCALSNHFQSTGKWACSVLYCAQFCGLIHVAPASRAVLSTVRTTGFPSFTKVGRQVASQRVPGCFPISKTSNLETYFPLQNLNAPQCIHNSCAAVQHCYRAPVLKHTQPGSLLGFHEFLKVTYSCHRRNMFQRNLEVRQINLSFINLSIHEHCTTCEKKGTES